MKRILKYLLFAHVIPVLLGIIGLIFHGSFLGFFWIGYMVDVAIVFAAILAGIFLLWNENKL